MMDDTLRRILEKARWAPSGDNAQPWRFRPTADGVLVRYRVDPGNIFESFGGRPIHLAVGMLLETMRIAAGREGQALQWQYEGKGGDEHRVAVQFAPGGAPDPLEACIETRSVDRFSYRTTPLTQQQKAALEAELGEELFIEWFEKPADKRRAACVNAFATDIRLRMPEAISVHRETIDWEHTRSTDRLPGRTIPVNAFSRFLMQWALRKDGRADIINGLFGTFAMQLELELLPGRQCAAHYLIGHRAREVAALRPADLIRLGGGLQRFWLRATQLGLVMQPSYATLLFNAFATSGIAFTQRGALVEKSRRLPGMLAALRGQATTPATHLLFSGRIGQPRVKREARSIRKPLEALMESANG